MVPDLSERMLIGLVGEPVLAADLPDAMAAFYELALPALLLVALRLVLPPLPVGARRALPAVAGLFAVLRPMSGSSRPSGSPAARISSRAA